MTGETDLANNSDAALFAVPGMTCSHCVEAVDGEVSKVDGVTAVSVDLEAKIVSVTGGDRAAVIAAIDEAGFDVA